MRHRTRIVLLTVLLTFGLILFLHAASWSPIASLQQHSTNTVVYHPFSVHHSDALANHTLRPLRVGLSDECLEQWVVRGHWEGSCAGQKVKEAKVDLVYVWVNGTDPLHQKARSEFGGFQRTRFREHDELRYSLRAAAKATEGWAEATWHIVTADFQRDGERRLGQVPQWLDLNTTGIRLHHHSQIFRTTDAEAANTWKDVLPTFNSYAIESQLPNLDPDIVSDNIVALNDDQFLMLPTPPSAFHSPLYGPVFRLEAENQVTGDDSGKADGNGEWRSLGWSGHLLNQRFGTRTRAYVSHNARALSLPLMHEALLAFGKEFSATPLSRFRGSAGFEVNTLFLCTHWVIERKREALLWSWIVAKWGNEGMLDQAAMWREMGGTDGNDDIPLDFENTWTALDEVDKQFAIAGIRSPRVRDRNVEAFTEYLFVSQDGYPTEVNGLKLPKTLSRELCFGRDENIAAWDLFVDVMKHKPDCGDAIIDALIHQERLAGGSGLSIFLPPPSISVPSTLASEPITLPLHLSPHAPPFPANPRLFALKLLYRYSFAIGRTPSRFLGLISFRQASLGLGHVTEDRDIALLCVNDDLERVGEDEVKRVDGLLREWFEEKWGERGSWERP